MSSTASSGKHAGAPNWIGLVGRLAVSTLSMKLCERYPPRRALAPRLGRTLDRDAVPHVPGQLPQKWCKSMLAIQRPGGLILRLNTTRGDSAQIAWASAFLRDGSGLSQPPNGTLTQRKDASVDVRPAKMPGRQIPELLLDGELRRPQAFGEKLEEGGVQLPLILKLRRVGGEKRQDFPVIRHWDPRAFPSSSEGGQAVCQNLGLAAARPKTAHAPRR